MNKIYTVRLAVSIGFPFSADSTVGTMDASTVDGQDAAAFLGEIVKARSHDVNGNPIEIQGKLIEVLEIN